MPIPEPFSSPFEDAAIEPLVELVSPPSDPPA